VEFAKQTEILANQPATIESKPGISCNCTSHFRYCSKLYAQEGAEAQAEAERHERLAQEYSAKNAAQENKCRSQYLSKQYHSIARAHTIRSL
jgi:hypothetical protein